MRPICLSPLLIASAIFTGPAIASSPAPVCAAIVAPPPAELAGWTHPVPLGAAAAADSAPALTLGVAAQTTLMPVGKVGFPVAVGRMSAPADKGGLLTFTAPTPGTYRVALGAGGWIDMVKGAVSVPSIAHAHGPDCTGIRKMVDFPLAAGAYTVQFSGSAMDAMTVLTVRLP